jgi:hypothetical protein
MVFLIPTRQIPEFLLFIYLLGWSWSKSTIIATTYWPIVPALDDVEDFGAVSGMNEWREKPKYLEKTCPSAALATIDSILDLPQSQTRDAAVGSRRLSARATARPHSRIALIQ